MNVKLKVCGITSVEDALEAIHCGAHYLGFNFYRKSPRFIEPSLARGIIEQLPHQNQTIAVGIFVNQPRPEEVIVMMHESRVQMAQLHGDEDADYCRRVGAERV